MRGHGRSGKPNDNDGYESKLYADDFMAVVEAYHLNKPVYVGWWVPNIFLIFVSINVSHIRRSLGGMLDLLTNTFHTMTDFE